MADLLEEAHRRNRRAEWERRGVIAAAVLLVVFWIAVALFFVSKAEAHYVSSCKGTRCKRHVVRPYNAWLNRTAWCESTGRWFIDSGNGFFGGLQFTLRSWFAVGGRGMPNRNSVLEQKYRGVILLHEQGLSAWPVCR